MTIPRRLTPKQLRFIDEYLIDLNGTQAAKRAGYSERTATQQASRLLTNANVLAAINGRIEERAARSGSSRERVLEELAAVSHSDIGPIAQAMGFDVLANLPEDVRRAISAFKVKDIIKDGVTIRTHELRLWDKVAGLRTLREHFEVIKNPKGEGALPEGTYRITMNIPPAYEGAPPLGTAPKFPRLTA